MTIVWLDAAYHTIDRRFSISRMVNGLWAAWDYAPSSIEDHSEHVGDFPTLADAKRACQARLRQATAVDLGGEG